MPGDGQIVVHNDATRLVDRHSEGLTDKGGHIAGGPDLHPTGNEFVANFQSGLGEIIRANAGADLNAELFQLLRRARRQVFRKTERTGSSPSTRITRALAGSI